MNMLLEDSSQEKVPELLEELIRSLTENDSIDLIQEDKFFLLITILMIENGLMPILSDGSEWNRKKTIDNNQLSHWKTKNSYEVFFLMSGFKEIPIQLILCPLGETMLLNLLINHDKTDVYSLFLSPKRYVTSTKASTIPLLFNDLKHLSYTYKNKIIVPAKSRILNFYGYPSASLVGLPTEVFFYLLLYLPLNDILNMCKTCKRIRSMIENDNFWHKLFIRDFKIFNQEDEVSWKSLYINKYNEEQEKKIKACHVTSSYSFIPQHSHYGAQINNPQIWSLLFD